MVRFVTVQELKVKIAAGIVNEALEEFTSQPKTKNTGHVLVSVGLADRSMGKFAQAAPYQMRPSAEIDHAPGQTFVHRYIGFPSEGILWMKTGSVTTNPSLISQGTGKRLTKSNPAIFDRVMRVHFQIACTFQ